VAWKLNQFSKHLQLNGGKDELKHKQSIEHDLNIIEMIKCKEGLNSPNKNAENSRTKEQVLEKRKWNLKTDLHQ